MLIDSIPLPSYIESESWGDYGAFNSSGVEKEVGELLYSFVRILKPSFILETGTAKGISSAYIASALKENKRGILDTIEYDSQHWEESENLWKDMKIDSYIKLHKKPVEEFSPKSVYQMLFLDSEPNIRWKELERFYPLLEPGGYVFLHDLPRGFCKGNINPDHPEIKDWPWGEVPKTIKDLIKDRELIPWHFPNPRSMAGFYKARPDDYKITS